MSRRLVLAATCAALAAATAVPSFAAGKPAACAAYTDPKGDSTPQDGALDITAVSFKSVGKSLVAAITVDKLAQRPALAVGNRFQVTFNVAGKEVVVYYKFSPTREQEANVFYQQGIRVDGVFYSDALEGKIDGNTVTMTVTASELKGAVGANVLGTKLTGLLGETMSSFVAQNQVADEAAAPASMTHTVGAACKG